ncbi:MAG TPA: hypothetical protein PKE55_10460 [Kiritimatiellia bacterium]|nr:hypothetical protein [Kiritimatiellia bacterium]
MAMFSKKESALERRQRELDREADRLREQVKALEKLASSLLAEGAVPGRKGGKIPDVEGEEFVDPEGGEPEVKEKQEEVVGDRLSGGSGTRRGGAADSARLANYLSTGSFGKASRSISYERRIMRNKAIVMFAAVVIVAFILFSLLR